MDETTKFISHMCHEPWPIGVRKATFCYSNITTNTKVSYPHTIHHAWCVGECWFTLAGKSQTKF